MNHEERREMLLQMEKQVRKKKQISGIGSGKKLRGKQIFNRLKLRWMKWIVRKKKVI